MHSSLTLRNFLIELFPRYLSSKKFFRAELHFLSGPPTIYLSIFFSPPNRFSFFLCPSPRLNPSACMFPPKSTIIFLSLVASGLAANIPLPGGYLGLLVFSSVGCHQSLLTTTLNPISQSRESSLMLSLSPADELVMLGTRLPRRPRPL